MNPDQHPNPSVHWFHRRTMAYWSMTVLTVAMICALTGTIRPEATELVVGLSWVFGTVVVLYYGGNVAQSFANRTGAQRAHTSDNSGQQKPML